MKTIFINTLNNVTPLAWDEIAQNPIWDGLSEPSLSILQNAYQQGDYEIIADPEPVEEPITPDWTPFNFQLFNNPAFVGYGLAANSVNPFLLPALVERYGLVAKDGLFESGFPAYWQAFCDALGVSVEHRTQWANLAVSFNLPVDFINVIRG